jgi:transposase InsO family protein
MQEKQEIEKSKPQRGGKSKGKANRYSPEFKIRAVKLHLEEGFSQPLVCEEMGMGSSSLAVWLKAYREQGEQGLRGTPPTGGGGGGARKLPAPVVEKILDLKRQNPWWGIKRISHVLRRMFLLSASPETVRKNLHEAQLMDKTRPKARRNMTRPRFFERATPNQLWQTDIFTFRLGGRYAYLIAFMDDYSRFVVGADLFRSPTAAATIEVYRVAAGEYQPPKEMLTDNGPQYKTWRGTSRFETEMKKDRVIHIKSRPQHPMTLGKVERFWATIWQEFLVRAQFDSFEAARERIKLWVKYYNYKRPHQGIGALCPADRYFEIQAELRQTIESGIQENLLEMALRGQPRAPFYMVGRMEGQSVVLHAEKGKLKLSVGNDDQNKELEYDLNKGDNHERNQRIKNGEQTPAQEDAGQQQLQCGGESAGGACGVDGEGPLFGSLPPVERELDHLQPVAAAGDGGNASGAGEPGESGQGGSPEPAIAGAVEQAPADGGSHPALIPSGEDPAGQGPGGNSQGELNESPATEGAGTGGGDPSGALGSDHGHGGSPLVGHLPQNVLPVGEEGAGGDDVPARTAVSGTAGSHGQPGSGGDEKEDRPTGEATGSCRTNGGGAWNPDGHAGDPGEARP